MADNLKQLITDVITGLDESVQDLYPFINTQMVDLAYGVWLDMLGEYVGCKPRTRDGDGNYYLSDDAYRDIVLAKVRINNDGATANNIANMVRYTVLLTDTNDWDSVKDVEVPMYFDNANIYISLSTTNEGDSNSIREFIPVGVGLYINYSTDNPFIVSDLTDDPVSPIEGDGLSDLDAPDVGGELSYFI